MTAPDLGSDAVAAKLERTGTILPGGAPDHEVASIMEELSDMQTWVTLLACRQVSGARDAIDLIQRTRCLIVERLFQGASNA